jgi:60 kDa SS-A/Ro ribonucleoprotein
MKTNKKAPTSPAPRTHEGAVAARTNAEQNLLRSVMAHMLWEDEFYEDGQSIAGRIAALVPLVKAESVAGIALMARVHMKLRHVPLLIVREMARVPSHKHLVASTLEGVIQRPDELAEFVSIYWKDKKQPLSAQVKKGLAAAFQKFDDYSLAKYNQDNAVKLRDVLFLCHAKPKDALQAASWKRLIDGTLAVPDTWEVALSANEGDKKAVWQRLLSENKLGALALLRNLRNMAEAGVGDIAVREALKNMKTERVLPFRFISATRHAPQFRPELEQAMFKCLEGTPVLKGKTILLVDVSGSMDSKVSGKSDISRLDAGCGLAMLLREVCESVQVVTFSSSVVKVAPHRGFALADAISKSQPHDSTQLGSAMTAVNLMPHDRLIVITDEQSADKPANPKAPLSYCINVASARNGIGYGKWTHIDGWSEAVVDYIRALEQS